MKKSVNDFTNEEMNIVRECFDEYSVSEIAKLLNLTYYEVLYCIHKIYPSFYLYPLVPGITITDQKILIMSDTHIGSKFENMDYSKEAKKFAIDNNIHTILHTGDVIQSTCDNVLMKYQNQTAQLEHLVMDFPYDPSIRYIMLFGNHDFNTFSKDEQYMNIFSSRKDFHLLGVKYGYINWLGTTIALVHPTKKYRIPIPTCGVFLLLRGHSHNLLYKKSSTVYVSTLSDDKIQNPNSRPGFLVGTNYIDHILLESYYFEESLHYGGAIFDKKVYVKK